MKIKQQKQIQTFLEKEFDKDKSNSLLKEQEKILDTLIADIKNKSKNQKKTLVQTILPGISLYKDLIQEYRSHYSVIQTIYYIPITVKWS